MKTKKGAKRPLAITLRFTPTAEKHLRHLAACYGQGSMRATIYHLIDTASATALKAAGKKLKPQAA